MTSHHLTDASLSIIDAATAHARGDRQATLDHIHNAIAALRVAQTRIEEDT